MGSLSSTTKPGVLVQVSNSSDLEKEVGGLETQDQADYIVNLELIWAVSKNIYV